MVSLDDKISQMDSFADEDLLSLVAQKGWDYEKAKAAFNVFYKRHSTLLWTLCRNVYPNSHIADEIFSRTMTAIFEYPTYDSSKGKITTWMSQIAKRKAYDLWKNLNTNELYIEEIGPTNVYEDEDVDVPLCLERQILDQALKSLSESEKDILMTYFRYQDGRKHLPKEVLQDLCNYHHKTADNIRQIKKRALSKVEEYIRQNSDLLS